MRSTGLPERLQLFDDARTLFGLGVEKVAIQSAFLEDPSVLRRIASHAGEQAVVASIDVENNWLGRQKVRASAGVRPRSSDWPLLLREAVANGAGEVLLTSVERDGTMKGMDLPLIEEASRAIEVPLIAAGGAGSLADISAAVAAGADAVAAGAFFVLHGPHRAVLITYPRYEELKALWQAG